MSGPDREDTSFDPRTWSGATEGATPTTAALDSVARDTTSFDPRAWGEDGAPPPPEPPATHESTRRLVIGGAAGLAIVAGIGVFVFGRGGGGSAPTPIATASPVAVAVAPPPSPVAAAKPASRRTLMVAGPGDILATLTGAGVPAAAAGAAAAAAKAAIGVAPGEIRLEFDLVGTGPVTTLTRLAATRADGAGLVLTAKAGGGFAREPLQARLTTKIEVVRGEMDANSFYSSAVAAGVDDTLIDSFANAFSYDFNFATDIAQGDIFEAAFERKFNPSGQPVGKPQLLYVSIATKAKSRALYRFLAPGEADAGWFDANGRSTVRALMRTPVDGARISSPFGMRFHPVLRFNKLHKGTDFAAPTGTPIYAAGNGTIAWAAMKGANGNLTILQHDNGWQTYYLHQSMFMPGIAPGVRVSQGQKIGEIGTTGRSTGPHLHFELHIDGQPVDPMSIDTGTGISLEGGALAAFRNERDRIDRTRAAAAN